MFTRLSKGILIFMEVALVIGSIVGGCIIGGENGGLGFGLLMILVFLLASFIILCSLGLFVELANNILDIKRILEKQNMRISPYDLANTAAEADAKRLERQEWFCSECGTRNPAGVTICKACGKGKYSI